MKKKKPLPPSTSERIHLGTRVEILKPNALWGGLTGLVEGFGNGFHLVRTNYPGNPKKFLVAARFEELKILSETKEVSK